MDKKFINDTGLRRVVNLIKEYVDTLLRALGDNLDNKQDRLRIGKGLTLSPNGELSATLDTTLYKIVSALPTSPGTEDLNKIFVVIPEGEVGKNHKEYIWLSDSNKWEELGSSSANIDLSNYVTTEALNAKIASLTSEVETLKSANADLTDVSTLKYINSIPHVKITFTNPYPATLYGDCTLQVSCNFDREKFLNFFPFKLAYRDGTSFSGNYVDADTTDNIQYSCVGIPNLRAFKVFDKGGYTLSIYLYCLTNKDYWTLFSRYLHNEHFVGGLPTTEVQIKEPPTLVTKAEAEGIVTTIPEKFKERRIMNFRTYNNLTLLGIAMTLMHTHNTNCFACTQDGAFGHKGYSLYKVMQDSLPLGALDFASPLPVDPNFTFPQFKPYFTLEGGRVNLFGMRDWVSTDANSNIIVGGTFENDVLSFSDTLGTIQMYRREIDPLNGMEQQFFSGYHRCWTENEKYKKTKSWYEFMVAEPMDWSTTKDFAVHAFSASGQIFPYVPVRCLKPTDKAYVRVRLN